VTCAYTATSSGEHLHNACIDPWSRGLDRVGR
jgi:hypothetical protein